MDDLTPEQRLRINVQELMDFRGMTQADLAKKLGRSQSWVSKRLSGKPQPHGSRFQLEDLGALGAVFELSPSELLRPGIGKLDRRAGGERRRGERRGRYELPVDREQELTERAERLRGPRLSGERFSFEKPERIVP